MWKLLQYTNEEHFLNIWFLFNHKTVHLYSLSVTHRIYTEYIRKAANLNIHILINAKQCQFLCIMNQITYLLESVQQISASLYLKKINLRALNWKLNKLNKHNLNSINLQKLFIIYFVLEWLQFIVNFSVMLNITT